MVYAWMKAVIDNLGVDLIESVTVFRSSIILIL
jgi:hypothetical protein